MKKRSHLDQSRLMPHATIIRGVVAAVMLLALASCASQASRSVETAVVDAERVAAEHEAAQLAAEQERARAAELQRERDRQAAERARAQEVRAQQVAEARARAEAQRAEQEAAEQLERERRAALAAVEADRRDRLDRIAVLEQQLAEVETEVGLEQSRVSTMNRAIETAEQLISALADEQLKYENVDDQGNTVDPLSKDVIAELESRKNELLRQANSQ